MPIYLLQAMSRASERRGLTYGISTAPVGLHGRVGPVITVSQSKTTSRCAVSSAPAPTHAALLVGTTSSGSIFTFTTPAEHRGQVWLSYIHPTQIARVRKSFLTAPLI